MKMNKSRPGFFLIIPLLLLVLVVVTTPSLIIATNESSYRYGYISGYLTLNPQNSPDANWYPELKNDTCSPSLSYKSGNGVVMPAPKFKL